MPNVEKKRLGDILNFKRGYDLPAHARLDGEYPVISSAGISGYHSEYKADGEGIVTGRYGTLGEMYYVKGKYWPHNTALYVTDFKGNFPKYIYYLLTCIGRMKTSDKSAVPGVNRNELHEVFVPFLPRNFQENAVSILSAIDEKIELNNKINAELDAVSKIVFDYWFVQFEFPAKEGKPYKSSGGKMFYSEILKREIPEGWRVRQLGNSVHFQRGISYRSSEIQDSGTPMLNLNSFNLNGSFKLDGTKYLNGKFKQSAKLNPGDLVIAITDVTRNADIIGKSFIVPDVFSEAPLISCDVAKVMTDNLNYIYYLQMLFNSQPYHDHVKYYASGTLVLHLDLNGVKWFYDLLPPDNLLSEFADLRKSVLDKQNLNIFENLKLTELRDWLLPMLVNGQVTLEEQALSKKMRKKAS